WEVVCVCLCVCVCVCVMVGAGASLICGVGASPLLSSPLCEHERAPSEECMETSVFYYSHGSRATVLDTQQLFPPTHTHMHAHTRPHTHTHTTTEHTQL